MTKQRKKALWLVSWYPNRNDRFDGDFIQRHAKAAAIDHDVHVIFVTGGELDQPLEEEWNHATGLTEQIIYFKKINGPFKKIRKFITWQSLYRGALVKYISTYGRPDVVHVHVPWKAGLIALWLKKKYGIDYIVTEHWGIYCGTTSDDFYSRPAQVRNSLKKIFAGAVIFTTISRYLADAVKKATGKICTQLIPNVVDTSLFYHKEEKYSRFSFIHVSNMVPLKNVDLILEAFSLLVKNAGDHFQLILVGNRDESLLSKASELNLLNTNVFFKGEVTYVEVAEEMRRSHCFVIFSDSETFSCVTAEALCCGLPVIAGKTGALPELVNESNGILVEPRDTEALWKAMEQAWKNYNSFDKNSISLEAASRYGYARVAGDFVQLYGSPGKPL
jgi:glycosyltransferase involved in cell wall biosynthesis